ncbi:MAG TPA: hypothetical protein DHU56_04240 [Marinobacter sp.]|nr:hypothetical protein [Marinobacter sp.]
MNDDISKKATSAYQVHELLKQQTLDEAKLDKRARQSSIKLESLLDEQTQLLKEANERAASMEKRAEESEKDAREAKRHSVWANIIALVALAITALQYLSDS